MSENNETRHASVDGLSRSHGADDATELRRRSLLELARRSVSGAFAYVFLIAVIGLTTPYRHESPQALYHTFAALVVLSILRLYIARRASSMIAADPDKWHRRFRALAVLSAMVMGAFFVVTIARFEWQFTTVLVTIVISGIMAGGSAALSPDRNLAFVYNAIIGGPAVLWCLADGTANGYAMGAVMSINLFYQLAQSKSHNISFWQALRDNHALAQHSEQLEASTRAAQQASEAKSRFLANMSHEIRTPLNAVIGMSDLLRGSVKGEAREIAETIQISGDALLSLINDILDYSKIESDHMELESRAFDIRECIEDAVMLLGAKAAEKGLEVVTTVSPSVPDTVIGDSVRLRQIVTNLLANAVKFTASGGVEIRLDSVATPDGRRRLTCAVRDTGAGIPKDRMNRLFRSFSQVDASTTRKHGGTGLGLVISRRLTELMGGEMSVESEHGKGSTFAFTITLNDNPDERAPEPPLAGRSVLIVAGSDMSRNSLQRIFEGWGAEAVATGVSRADQVAPSRAHWDVLVADGGVQPQDTQDTLFAIKNAAVLRATPVVLLRPMRISPTLNEDTSISDGFVAEVTKPVRSRQLLAAVRSVVTGSCQLSDAPEVADHRVASPSSLRVLVAEDNPVNQRVAILMLERLGYQADLAPDGVHALEAARKKRYDVILMDVHMPNMDGMTATRELRKIERDGHRAFVVAMTAAASQEDRDNCLAAGMDFHLPKPVRKEQLAEVLAQCSSHAAQPL